MHISHVSRILQTVVLGDFQTRGKLRLGIYYVVFLFLRLRVFVQSPLFEALLIHTFAGEHGQNGGTFGHLVQPIANP